MRWNAKKKVSVCLCMLLAIFTVAGVVPQMRMEVRAANEEFTIKDGVLTKYSGNDTEVVIPEGVTCIGDSAFSGCSGATSITIPNGVTSIESGAFSGCSGLTGITIPNSVTSIGCYTFSSF